MVSRPLAVIFYSLSLKYERAAITVPATVAMQVTNPTTNSAVIRKSPSIDSTCRLVPCWFFAGSMICYGWGGFYVWYCLQILYPARFSWLVGFGDAFWQDLIDTNRPCSNQGALAFSSPVTFFRIPYRTGRGLDLQVQSWVYPWRMEPFGLY